MRCKRFKPGARREEEEYPHGSSTDEQHGSSLKDLQPFGLSYGGPLAARFRSVRRDNGSIAISGPSRHNLSRRGTVGPEARLRHGVRSSEAHRVSSNHAVEERPADRKY
jgi:hypothetical protein